MLIRFFCMAFVCSITSFFIIGNAFSQSFASPADVVISNAQILQKNESFAQAMAIKDQKIVAIGNHISMQQFIGLNTQQINAQGKLIIPGLIDSHMHAIRAGLSYQSEASWRGVRTIPEAIDIIRQASLQKPRGSWIIIAGGWIPEQFKDGVLPSREQLLNAAPDHHLYIQKLYSSVFISPSGLEALGVAKNAELLSRLDMLTDKNGQLTGWINGNARAISDLFDFLPAPTIEDQYTSTKLFFKKLNQLAITGVADPGGYNFPFNSYKTLWRLQQEKSLSIRVAYSISAPHRGTELEDFKKIIPSIPRNDEFLQWNGIGENVTWGMYNNESPTATDQQQLQDVLTWAAQQKITVTFHWNNNESVYRLLDVIERIQNVYPIKDLRWSIAHLNNIDELSLSRMKKYKLGWLVQNALYFQSGNFADKYGYESLKIVPRIRQGMNLQLPIGVGTDAHRVMDFNPFVAIEWLIGGKSIDGRPGRENQQLLTPHEAINLYTQGSAHFLPDSTLRGELAVGKYADLAILDQNLLTIPIHQIHQTQAELTMVGGRVVFASGEFAALEKQ